MMLQLLYFKKKLVPAAVIYTLLVDYIQSVPIPLESLEEIPRSDWASILESSVSYSIFGENT